MYKVNIEILNNRGPCFIEYLEKLPVINRTISGPLRMPIIDKYKVEF